MNDHLKAREIVDRIFDEIDTDGSGKVDFKGKIYFKTIFMSIPLF
jgi:hypothetical protein